MQKVKQINQVCYCVTTLHQRLHRKCNKVNTGCDI